MYFSRMNKRVWVATLILAALVAVLNNALNPNSIAWFGSPEVLPKPSGWPSMGLGQGLLAGVLVAWKDALKHLPWVLGILALAIGGSAGFRMGLKRSPTPWLLSLFRLLMAYMFLAAAYPKFTDPEGFATLVAQYQFLPAFLVNPFSLALPALEILVGLGLILTPWEKEFGALLLLLMGMFLVALGQALARDLGIACGCFDIEGAADAGETWFSLLRDIVLVVPVIWLMITGRRRWIWQLK